MPPPLRGRISHRENLPLTSSSQIQPYLLLIIVPLAQDSGALWIKQYVSRISAILLLLEVSTGITHVCRHRSLCSIPWDSQERSDHRGASDGRSGTWDRGCQCPTGWPHTDGTKDGSLKEAGDNGYCHHKWTKQSCYWGTLPRTQGRHYKRKTKF